MPDLHFNITGECSGAISAISDTKSAIAGLDGTRANFSIGSSGADRTIAQLQSVGAARDAVTGVSSVDVQARGIEGVTSDLRGLRGEVASTAGSMSALNGMDIGGGSSVRQMVSDLGGARQAFQGILGDSESVGAAVRDAGASVGQFAGDAEPAMAMVGARTAQVDEAMQAVAGSTGGASRAMSGLGSAVDDSGEVADAGAGRFGRLSQAIGGVLSRNALVAEAMYDGADGMAAANAVAGNLEGSLGGVEGRFGGVSSALKSATAGGADFESMMSGAGVHSALFNGTGPIASNRFQRGDGTGPGSTPPRPPIDDGNRGGGGGNEPPRPPGDDGGRGGGGRSGGRSRGFGDGLGQPLMMGAAIGGVESLVTGAAGFMAVNEAIKHTPDLAYAANQAMGQFGKGIRQAASSAIAEGVPALHALSGVLHNAGVEVGALGAEHMGTAIAGVSDLASVATESLKKLDPAVESSMKGLVGLGEAVMNGIANPAVVTALKNVGDALSDPKNEQGIQSLVSGLSTVSGIAAKVAIDVGGAVGNLTGLGGDAVTPALQSGLTAGMMTKSPLMGGLVGLATLQAQQEEAAGRSDLVTPGVVGGAAGAFGAHTLGKGMGLKGGKLGALTAGGYLLGDAANIAAAQGDKAAGTGSLMSDMAEFGTAGVTIGASLGGPWGAAGGFLLGTAAGFAKNTFGGDAATDGGSEGTTGSNDKGFAPGRSATDYKQAGRYGWQQDDKGNMRPGTAGDRAFNTHQEAVRRSQGMASGGNAFPGMAHAGPAAGSQAPPSGPLPGLPGGNQQPGLIPRGPGSSVGPASSALQQLTQGQDHAANSAQQLTSRNNALTPSLNQVSQGSQGVSSGMNQVSQSSAQLNHSQQLVTQSAAHAAAVSTLMGASFNTAGQQAQRLPQAVAPTMDSLAGMSSQVNSSMQGAQSSMVSGGNQLGRSMPKHVSDGIASGQSEVCDASQQMMQGAADCAGSAGGIKSPSTVFNYFGQMLGAGLAQGISGSSGMAAGAAGAAMMNVSSVASNYAADAGLNLGTMFGTNLVSGINTTIKSSALKATGLAQGVDSPLAKMMLGQLGLLGKAGSGAQSWDLLNNAGVASFGSGTPANSSPPPTIPPPQVFVQIGNHALDPHILQVSTRNFEELAAALAGAKR